MRRFERKPALLPLTLSPPLDRRYSRSPSGSPEPPERKTRESIRTTRRRRLVRLVAAAAGCLCCLAIVRRAVGAPERVLYNTRVGSRPLVVTRDFEAESAVELEHVLIVRRPAWTGLTA